MALGPMAITLSRCLSLGSVHLLQPEEAQIIHMFHHQGFSLSLHMVMHPTKGAIMIPIMPQGQDMGAETTPILPIVNKVTQIPGSENQDTRLLWLGIRTLLACIQPLVPRRPTSRILLQLPVLHHCSQRVDTQGLWGLHLFLLLPSAQKMSWST